MLDQLDTLSKRTRLAILLAVVLASVLFMIAARRLSDSQTTVSITDNIGVGLALAAFLSFILTALGLDPAAVSSKKISRLEQIEDEIRRVGFRRLSTKPDYADFERRLRNATQISSFHHTGINFMKFNMSAIERAIKENNCQVRMIISDGSRSFWTSKSQEMTIARDLLCPGVPQKSDLNAMLGFAQRILQDLAEVHADERNDRNSKNHQRGSFELRLYPGFPPTSLIVIDDSFAVVTGYLPASHSNTVPVLEVEKTAKHPDEDGVFRHYSDAFEKAWLASKAVAKTPESGDD